MGTKKHHPIRSGRISSGDPDKYDYDEIANYIRGADSTALSSLAGTYGSVHFGLQEAQKLIENNAGLLASVWKSGTAEQAVDKVRQLQAAAGALATATQQFHDAMSLAAKTVGTYKATLPTKTRPQPSGVISSTIYNAQAERTDDGRVREHMRQLNADLARAYNDIPAAVTMELPADRGEAFDDDPAGGAGEGGGVAPADGTDSGAGGTAGVEREQPPFQQVGLTENSSGGLSSSAIVPEATGTSASPADLAGVPSAGPVNPGSPGVIGPGSSAFGSSGVAPGGVGTGGGGQIGFGLPGPLTGGLGHGVPPGGVAAGGRGARGVGLAGPHTGIGPGGVRPGGIGLIGPGGVIGGGTTTPRSVGTPGSRGSAAPQSGVIGRSQTGGPFVPLGGTGAVGGSSQDRQRQTWLTEDEDVWTDGAPGSPPVLGG